jgi:hypothetical protein
MESNPAWKKKSYEELLSPLVLQFDRSKNCYSRYLINHHFLHAQTLKKANTEILRLLCEKTHLIPDKLMEDALKLIDHLDVWFEQYEHLVLEQNPRVHDSFVFHRPAESIEFPKQSELNFRLEKDKLKKELSLKE